jgi:hypothetical protein
MFGVSAMSHYTVTFSLKFGKLGCTFLQDLSLGGSESIVQQGHVCLGSEKERAYYPKKRHCVGDALVARGSNIFLFPLRMYGSFCYISDKFEMHDHTRELREHTAVALALQREDG